MSVKFDVAAKLDFSKYRYLIVLNTSGNGLTPETQPQRSDWLAYSYVIETDGKDKSSVAGVWQYLAFPECPTCVPAYIALLTTTAQFQYIPDSNGSGTEFSVVIDRAILSDTMPFSTRWHFNAFTLRVASGSHESALVDSMGRCGSCFVSPVLPTTASFDRVIRAEGSAKAIPAAARIASVEFSNTP